MVLALLEQGLDAVQAGTSKGGGRLSEVRGKWRERERIEHGEVIESGPQGLGLGKRNDDARALRIVGQQGMQVVEIFAQQKCGAMSLGDGRVGGPITQLRSDGAELIVC